MNKYQTAIIKLAPRLYSDNKAIAEDNLKQLEVLQELIDNYSKMEKALDKACDKLHDMAILDNQEFNIHSVVYSKDAWKEWLLNDK